jgi:hypothetical protein
LAITVRCGATVDASSDAGLISDVGQLMVPSM